jgi:hypothetical protein
VCLALLGCHAVLAAENLDTLTLGELHAELAERDAVILDLLGRVRALEQALAASTADVSRGTAASAALAREDTSGSGASPGGGLAIDERQAQRAPEISLVDEGAQLLAPGQIELAPEFTLLHDEGMFRTALRVGDASVVGEVERTLDVYERGADLRIGLPFASQLELNFPYRVVDQQVATGISGAVQTAMDDSGAGFGDVAIGLAKVLAWPPRDRGGRTSSGDLFGSREAAQSATETFFSAGEAKGLRQGSVPIGVGIPSYFS